MRIQYESVDMKAIMQRSYDMMDDIQRGAVSHGRSFKMTVLDMWLGTGKTFCGLTIGLMQQPQRYLIICSKGAINGWRQDIKKFYPEFGADSLFNIVRGTAAKRQELWKRPSLFYVVTGGSFIRDIDWLLAQKVKFDVIDIDEPQKLGLRNRKSQGFKAVKAISDPKYKEVKAMTMTTGTLTSKGSPQLWSYLHILNRKRFAGYWPFVETYNAVVKGPFGRYIGGPKNTQGLAEVTRPHIYRIDKKMAESVLPPFKRIKLMADMTEEMKVHYRSLIDEMYMDFESGLISVANPITAYTKARQFLCCPAIIEPSLGHGPAIEAVADKILDNDEDPLWLHNIVFTPFLPSIPIFKDYLIGALNIKESQVLVLKGGDEPEYVQEVEHKFRRDPNTMILSSLKFAASWNAETARHTYFPHFEWDQDDNEQAEGRARRKTSDRTHLITNNYVSFAHSVTEEMFDVLNAKVRMNKATYQNFEELAKRIREMAHAKD